MVTGDSTSKTNSGIKMGFVQNKIRIFVFADLFRVKSTLRSLKCKILRQFIIKKRCKFFLLWSIKFFSALIEC